MSEAGDALVTVHDEGGDAALSVVGAIMEHNSRAITWSLEQQIEFLERELDAERARRIETERELSRTHRRIMWLVYGDPDLLSDYTEGP